MTLVCNVIFSHLFPINVDIGEIIFTNKFYFVPWKGLLTQVAQSTLVVEFTLSWCIVDVKLASTCVKSLGN